MCAHMSTQKAEEKFWNLKKKKFCSFNILCNGLSQDIFSTSSCACVYSTFHSLQILHFDVKRECWKATLILFLDRIANPFVNNFIKFDGYYATLKYCFNIPM